MPAPSRISKPDTSSHAEYSPSKAETWLNCTIAIPTIRKLGLKSTTSPAAELGTAAHECLASCLKQWKHPSKMRGKTFGKYKCDGDMVAAVAVAYEYVDSLRADGYKIWSERKVAIKATEEFGTLDIAALKKSDLIVLDYKHGKGVPVEAKRNAQMRLYALGILDEEDLRPFVRSLNLGIIQPRCNQQKPIDIYKEDLKELYAFEREATEAVLESRNGRGRFYPTTKGCLWCPLAKHGCKAYAKFQMQAVSADFDKAECKDPVLLSEKEFLRIFTALGSFSAWVKQMYSLAHDRALKGKLPGYKLVEGDAKRKWSDEANVITALRKLGFSEDDFLKTSLEGLGAVSALFDSKAEADKFLKKWTVRPKGKPQLVPDSDSRPSINPADDFAGIQEEEE